MRTPVLLTLRINAAHLRALNRGERVRWEGAVTPMLTVELVPIEEPSAEEAPVPVRPEQPTNPARKEVSQ